MVSSARTSSFVAWVRVTPIACNHPSGSSLSRFAKSWLTGEMVARTASGGCISQSRGPRGGGFLPKLDEGRDFPDPRCRRSQCFRLRLQEPVPEMEALEAHVLPSSRLANEAAGTTIRFIQASASPPCPTGSELRCECISVGVRPEMPKLPPPLHFSVDASQIPLSGDHRAARGIPPVAPAGT